MTNHPRDAQELERRHSNGRGLLHADGASRANILSGDAPHSMLTMSTVLLRGRGALGRDYAAYFSRPYAAARTAVLGIADVARERRAAARLGDWPEGAPTGAVHGWNRCDDGGPDHRPIAGDELFRPREPQTPHQAAGAAGHEHAHVVPQQPKGADVEMVEMDVGDQARWRGRPT